MNCFVANFIKNCHHMIQMVDLRKEIKDFILPFLHLFITNFTQSMVQKVPCSYKHHTFMRSSMVLDKTKCFAFQW